MRYLYIIISILLLFGCNYETQYNSTEKSNSPAAEIDTVSEKQKIPLKDSAEIKKLENDPLPFFNIKIEDNSFSIFYNELVKSCLNKDTTAVLSAIYDTLRFSKYECAYGYFTDTKSCNGCMRCTKKGMLEGIFAGSTNEEVCSRLLELITKFGIGPYKDNSYYNKFMLIENAYSNFHFVDDSLYDDYFNYGMIIPLKDKIEIKAKPSELSNTINYLPFKAMPYANEPGMGIRSEDANFYWLEHNGGFFKSSDVLTGFDYTFVIFEKTPSGWKITGFIQPPGC